MVFIILLALLHIGHVTSLKLWWEDKEALSTPGTSSNLSGEKMPDGVLGGRYYSYPWLIGWLDSDTIGA